jgi:hypothetical protein
MNKGIGGEKLRRTLIEKKKGCLGPFHCVTNPHMINVCKEQQLVYPAEEEVTPGDGPFHLSAVEKESLMCNSMFKLPPNKFVIRRLQRRNLLTFSSTLTVVEMMVKSLSRR